jgi:hypothetical protein
MKWLRLSILVVVALVIATFVWAITGETNRFRYRLTFDVTTPSGPRSGSSVIAVEHTRGRDFWGMMNSEAPTLKGESVMVDLGGGKMLVGLLKTPTDSLAFMPVAAFHVENRPEDERNARFRRLARLPPGTAVVLSSDLTPRMLVLDDVNNPVSAHAVAPDTFESVLGPGYRFNQARIEIAPPDTPLNDTIAQRLPWWRAPGRPALIALHAAGENQGWATEEDFSLGLREGARR